ncbi:MAG TPA: BolA family transcriptional regulator [Hellea balneolensis]|uniref:BolA family transcriptional regulator n=1 Tax=Hellea balneolensis TaxID=287478 RepID=A0A7C5R8C1_9PROT|nr:BolA family transcriptional regulator [Hellea balneolensis]
MGPIATLIKEKLTNAFNPTQLEIIDESHRHSGHAGMAGHEAVESHFRVIIRSPSFEGLTTLAKHRTVMDVLAEEMDGKVHALSLDAGV